MTAPTYKASIYIAGDLSRIEDLCRHYCLRGLCVTVTPTTFIFTGGQECGAIVGLINYPRFPSEPDAIRRHAIELANKLMGACCQRSCTVEFPEESNYLQNTDITVPR